MNIIEILKKLVSFNTIADKENILIMNYIKNYLEKYNFNCELVGNEKKLLIARTKNKPIIGFVGHTDTVNYSSTFGSNPFELKEENGNLYGLGVCDMKGGIAAILKAISEIDFSKYSNGMMIVLTYDEEIAFTGIKKFLELNYEYPEYLIVGEPTNNVPMNGSKGAIEYIFDFNGKKAHSSMITQSSNIECVKFLNELLKLNSYFQRRKCDEYKFKYSTMNYGIINGGERANIVSSHTRATCDFRITKSIEEYNYVKKYVDKLSLKYDMKKTIGMDFLPFYNDSDFVTLCEEITGNKRGKFFGLSEASTLKGNRIILGPGPITAHEDKEHISVKMLEKTFRVYKDIIEEVLKRNEKR